MLVKVEAPTWVHETVVGWMARMLHEWARAQGGRVATSGVKYGVAARRGRQPDLSAYLPGSRRPPGRTAVLRDPPTIAVEVVSPTPRDTKRDRIDKMGDYARFGIAWYWIVDPQIRSVEVFRLGGDGAYAFAGGAGAGNFAVPGCDGLVLDLDALWKEVDDAEAGAG